jgi:hypothetical protein
VSQVRRQSIGTLARNGAAAGIIKLASAGLAFLVFVAAAMVTDERQFGLFSTAYASASLVSFFSLIGQHAVVMRFWPQYAGGGDLSSANGLMVRVIVVAAAGLVVASLLMFGAAFLPFATVPEWFELCLATTALAFALGWSEFTSCAFRAKNALFSGLLPRDIFWRLATIAGFAAAGFFSPGISAVAATSLAAGLLVLCVLPQTVVLLRDTFHAPHGALSKAQKIEFKAVTFGLWGVTALPPALGQASTLLVAAILGPEAAGAIFVADRVMRLAVLALNGINQALAPQISSAFHSHDRPHVQRIAGLAAISGFGIALIMLLVFVLFGKLILAVFRSRLCERHDACGPHHPRSRRARRHGLRPDGARHAADRPATGAVPHAGRRQHARPRGNGRPDRRSWSDWCRTRYCGHDDGLVRDGCHDHPAADRHRPIDPRFLRRAGCDRVVHPFERPAMRIVQVQTQAEAGGAQRISDMVGEGLRAPRP